MGILNQRLKNGKEDPERLRERFGVPDKSRPDGTLMWVHVASVGEAQSMLYLINLFLTQNPTATVLVTSITRTSADLLEKRLPARALHQYLPVDRPKWVKRFLNHWNPDLILWAESELWPAMLSEISTRRIPTALLNARMSPKSFKNWSRAKTLIEDILKTFTVILTQSDKDRDYYTALGGRSVVSVGNIKFAASPLPYAEDDLTALKTTIHNRPVWLYASTHAGEEELAAETHRALLPHFPNLLTIIAPRHPERRDSIKESLARYNLPLTFRGKEKILPLPETSLYVVDTLGELGLFYRLAPIACIGRSFSHDGGGGHNPLEAAQLGCAVLHGPNIQNLSDIYTPMDEAGASINLSQPSDIIKTLETLLNDKESLKNQSEKGYNFAKGQEQILSRVVEELEPVFLLADCPILKVTT